MLCLNIFSEVTLSERILHSHRKKLSQVVKKNIQKKPVERKWKTQKQNKRILENDQKRILCKIFISLLFCIVLKRVNACDNWQCTKSIFPQCLFWQIIKLFSVVKKFSRNWTRAANLNYDSQTPFCCLTQLLISAINLLTNVFK